MTIDATPLLFKKLYESQTPFVIVGEIVDGRYWFKMRAAGHEVCSGDLAKIAVEMLGRVITLDEVAQKP